jgi:site-specific recombinase XerD
MPVRFYLHTKTYSDGRRPIYADIRWGKGDASSQVGESRLRTGTGQSCLPKHFKPADPGQGTGTVGSAAPNYAKTRRELTAFAAKADKLIEQAEATETELTPAILLAQLKPKAAAKKAALPGSAAAVPPAVPTMVSLYADWRQAYGGRRAAKTLQGPAGLIDQLERWRPGTRPDELQADATGRCRLFEEFCQFCLTEAKNRRGETGLLNNTLSSYVKRLSKLLKFGKYDTAWLEDDFSEEIEREPLTWAEVEQLYNHPVFEPREGTGTRASKRAGIRDVFIFICRTGPRYSSMLELGPDALVWEWDESAKAEAPVLEYFHYKNRRNKTKLRVPLDPVALEIWQRYGGQLPVPSLGKFNEEIKLLCREAGLSRVVKDVRGSGAARHEERVPLWQTVSAHIGRYTFITTQHEGGADLVSIQDTVGHADINTTRRYTKSREQQRLATTRDAFERHRSRHTNS